MTNATTHVAGVTFANEATDGGKLRQEILKELAATGNKIITVDLLHTTFYNTETKETEFAIKCMEHRSKQIIGYIPRTELKNRKNTKQMTGFLTFYKNTYGVTLSDQIAPTRAQYHYVKDICKRLHKPMPAYDQRAYVNYYYAIEKEN